MSKKTYSFICFTSSAVLLTLALLMFFSNQTLIYQTQLQLGYIRSIHEVSTQLSAISTLLQKSQYAGTDSQIAAISADILHSSGTAKAALLNLPTDSAELADANKFLSQVGNYSMYISKKSMSNEPLTPQEVTNFEAITAYSKKLSQQFSEIDYIISLHPDKPIKYLNEKFPATDSDDDLIKMSAIMSNSTAPQGFPTLIYDGPFSDHLLDHNPNLTKNLPEINVEKAREIAAQFSGIAASDFTIGATELSSMPSYTFISGGRSVGVTKNGGFVTYILNGRDIEGVNLSYQRARDLARSYLDSMNIKNMTETYFELSSGVLTINYAYLDNGVICYTDLIKVGIAMDNGDTVFFDARGYINNHKERKLILEGLSSAEAVESVNKTLKLEEVRLALIPTAGGNEVLTYEFRCKGKEDEDVLVYINLENGDEEEILILLQNQNGTLAI